MTVPGSGSARRPAGWLRRHAIDVRPLRHPAYRRLFAGTAVGFYGFQFTAVAVPVEMYALTGSSFWVGLLGIGALVPLLVFGLWGGAIADVLDRRKLLLAGSLLSWSATLGLLAQSLLRVGSPVLLLALVGVQSAAYAVSSPTRQAIIPRIVPEAEVPAANTLGFTASNAGAVLGPLTAGLVFAAWGTRGGLPVAYGVDATLFAASLWATVRLPPLPVGPADPADPAGSAARWRQVGGTLANVMAGLRYLAGTPVLLLSFAIDVVAMVLAMPRALFPEVAAERFGAGAIGWLYASIAIGSVFGGLTSGWIGRVRRQGAALVTAVVGWGLAVAAAGLAGSLWWAVLLLAVAGCADLVSAVFRQTILQLYAPDEMRGRLQGVFIVVVSGGPRLGDLRAGAVAAGFGVTASWVGGGIGAAAVAIALAVTFPSLWRYRRRPADQRAGPPGPALPPAGAPTALTASGSGRPGR